MRIDPILKKPPRTTICFLVPSLYYGRLYLLLQRIGLKGTRASTNIAISRIFYVCLGYTSPVWLHGCGLTVHRRNFIRDCWRFSYFILTGTAVVINPAVPNPVRNRVDSESARQLQGLD
jgi:hypothetical protein